MTILVDRNTRVLVQGLTGKWGQFHTRQMLDYGTNVVAGITPSKGGEWFFGKPIFDTVKQAKKATEANCSVIFAPAPYAADAIFEAINAEIELIICITEGIPIADMVKVTAYLRKSDSRLIGPNCPGLLAPGETNIGIMPGFIGMKGPIGVVSKGGALTYEVIFSLTQNGLGQSTCVGIGSDPIHGLSFVDILRHFEEDPDTERVVMVGEIGGTEEQEAADFIAKQMTKPVVGLVVGLNAPIGKTMGHAGALIEGSIGSATEKIAKLKSAGVHIADYLEQIPDIVKGLG